jgi:hypothetical protein
MNDRGQVFIESVLFTVCISLIAACIVCVVGYFLMSAAEHAMGFDVTAIKVKPDAWFVWSR